ncbi:MAG: cytochrome c biogenesis protein CcsA [Actinomycetota bacterium]|nr:MAG: cytochrome c biogenesis protein CcsA [Actinomycetota bacterium]
MALTASQPTRSPSEASANRGTGTRATRVLGVAVILGIVWLVLFGLVISPEDAVQGESVRILYVHVPSAWLAYLAFVVTAVSSAAYLWRRTRSLTWDRLAAASAEVGVLFMAITLVTGSLWGRITWGTFWTWDAPHHDSVLVRHLRRLPGGARARRLPRPARAAQRGARPAGRAADPPRAPLRGAVELAAPRGVGARQRWRRPDGRADAVHAAHRRGRVHACCTCGSCCTASGC